MVHGDTVNRAILFVVLAQWHGYGDRYTVPVQPSYTVTVNIPSRGWLPASLGPAYVHLSLNP